VHHPGPGLHLPRLLVLRLRRLFHLDLGLQRLLRLLNPRLSIPHHLGPRPKLLHLPLALRLRLLHPQELRLRQCLLPEPKLKQLLHLDSKLRHLRLQDPRLRPLLYHLGLRLKPLHRFLAPRLNLLPHHLNLRLRRLHRLLAPRPRLHGLNQRLNRIL